MNEISIIDWLLGFAKTSVFGVLSGIGAWYISLPAILSGFIAFIGLYVTWVVIQINQTIKRLERRGIENHDLRYFQSGNLTLIESPRAEAGAFIRFRPNGDILDGYNISSLGDSGIGKFTISFTPVFSTDDIKAFAVGTPPKDLKFISVNRGHAQVTFDETDNPIVALKFEI